MTAIPGMGLVRGMGLTLRRFFQPKATIMWPEQHADVAPKFRGRLQLLYDEYGTLKCETCFQCAQACPIECIDMGGVDTKGRFHVHWGAAETYGERREESALRRSGRPVADDAYARFEGIDIAPLDAILEAHDYDPREMLAILEETQAEYGYLPVAALKHISRITGAWYAQLYGTATYYRHLRFEPPAVEAPAPGTAQIAAEASFRSALDASLGYGGRALMTTFLQTPREWASVLLVRAGTLAADPSDLDAAVRAGAFEGLKRAVRDLGATGTIATIAASGLRGRGGAGFPTAEKWRDAADRQADQKYVIANGYGADPAVQTDAALLAADPWSVIEGLAIAAFSVGATEAILAVRGEDTALVTMLEGAVLAAEEAGFLGDDAAGSGHRVAVTVRPVQGAYMLGEETVLIKALEGKRGQPDQRPPYPTEKGLFERPTVVNNVQTLAAVPWIVVNGGDVYATIGAKASPGTVLVQLRGPEGAGIAEVPLGTPLRELVELAGGTGGRALKAVLVGGPTGGLLPADALDTPYAYEDLAAAGAHMGSGSVVLADDRACVVDLARLLTKFSADSACGKSIPCRIGLRRLYEIGDRMAAGTPRLNDPALLGDLAHDIAASALCDHERLATLPFTSAMRYFRPELDDHLLRSTCPAGVCTPIVVGAGATAAGTR